MNRFDMPRLREQAEMYLDKFDDRGDKDNYRHPYLRSWMLKRYDCATVAELRSWIRYG